MQVLITCFGETKCFSIESNETYESLIAKVQSEFGITEDLSLYDLGQKVESIQNVASSSSLFAAIDLIGGGKKRGAKKRKAYTTPKKNKHKHQNVKLHALSYYAINKDNHVEKTKLPCESETCKGKGIFMASHWNRHYCGRCHVVLVKKNAPKEEPKKVKVVAKVDAPAASAAPAKGKKK